MERIVRIASMSIDLERIRIIKINNFTNLGPTNILTIEYNSQIEYTQNPFTNEIEKNEVQNVITKVFPDFETAQIYQGELEDCWRDFLNDKYNETKF